MSVNDGSGYYFIQDLMDFDITKIQVDFPHFSANGNGKEKRDGEENYSSFLAPFLDSSVSPGTIHFRFDLVKKLDSRVVKSSTNDWAFDDDPRGYGPLNWVDPATIQDHVLNVKIWKVFSEFVKRTIIEKALPLVDKNAV
jgi:hypothetical protein